ncbi:hypothetical protein EX895_002039 [Sporisorium graminicola]|uniref:Zn(2)-C6 fungal-type domain-containing protein n=1 Tax=Sporisorium graminicola TaxID=280036 RepID=A0A4U7L183_9BASI|nr:hypothetical protein EX895_002039 [Sporisorium graminicola]TKY89508.1 hypothetical protein EX895_002039 [Sporisorium graminicola]
MVVTTTATAAANAGKSRTMNRSCIQCRERKIKCDRLDPCNQCISKGSADECKRELRKKRDKNKRPFPKRKSRVAVAPKPAPGSDAGSTPSMRAWAEQSMTSASHHSESSHTPSSGSGRVVTPNTSSSVHDFANSSAQAKGALPAFSNQSAFSHHEHKQGDPCDSDDASSIDSDDSSSDEGDQPDNRLQMLEANHLIRIHSAPPMRCPFALKDVYAEWRAMPVTERLSLIQDVRAALPSLAQTLHLIHDVYVQRLHSLHGNVVHIPTIQVVLTEMLSDPTFEQRDRYNFGTITTALMVVFAALRFAPLDRTYTWGRSSSSSSPVKPLGHKEIRQRQRKIFALVKRIQRFNVNFTFGSVPELQTAVLMLACGKGSSSFLETLADCAIRSAMRMRIHRVGSLERLHDPGTTPTQVAVAEMAVRCWWALVRRDWGQSNKNRTYRISSSQFNTRQPLNLFDDELMKTPCPRSHLRSTWTHVSYSFATIDFAIMTRTLVDQVNAESALDEGPESALGWGLAAVFGQRLSPQQRDSLDQMFQSLVAAFPAHYSLEARYEVIGLVDVERWLLHQRLFYLFLALHMPLVSEATRPHGSLMYMAGHILDIQDKVSDICVRLDNCYLSTLQTLRACLVLVLDLFFTEAPVNISGLSRLMTRRKITAALEKIPMDVLSSTTKLCVQLLRLLLGLEEQHHQLQMAAAVASGVDAAEAGNAAHQADEAPVLDTVALRHRWHATCQVLDILLNDGYWRSFRQNLFKLENVPEWLQLLLQEVTEDAEQDRQSQPSQCPLAAAPPSTSASSGQPVSTTPSDSLLATPQFVNAVDAGSAQPAVDSNESASFAFTFDPKLLDDFDVSSFDVGDESSQMPQFDMDLIGRQDLEGIGNSSQAMDFAKMLMEWRVEVPLSL